MSDTPAFTVAICTRDRPRSIERALNSIAACDKPLGAWELIVVDNGSADLPSGLFAAFEVALPIKVVREKKAGLSNARNAAIASSAARHIIWTDDDVIVGKNWLRAYEDAFARWPDAGFFGGAIHPLFEPAAPDWLTRGFTPLGPAFAFRDEPSAFSRIESGARELPFGANMAFRGPEQRRFRFDPRLGRGSGHLAVGEDIDVMRKILDAGGYGIWIPSAGIEHVIESDRQTTGYVWEYFYTTGLYRGATGAETPSDRDYWMQWLQVLKRAVRYVRDRASGKPEVWTARLRWLATAIGELRAPHQFHEAEIGVTDAHAPGDTAVASNHLGNEAASAETVR